MDETGSHLRGWILAAVAALALFLAGLVLSYVLWLRIEPGTPPPCAKGREARILAVTDRMLGAADLLGPGSPEIHITPRHIFHFPFDYACFAPTGETAEALLARLGVDWPCARSWTAQVGKDDTFISMFAISNAQGPSPDVTAVRLRRADFDLAGTIRQRLQPDMELVFRKRAGSEQVLVRTP